MPPMSLKSQLIPKGGLDSYGWDDWITIHVLAREAVASMPITETSTNVDIFQDKALAQ